MITKNHIYPVLVLACLTYLYSHSITRVVLIIDSKIVDIYEYHIEPRGINKNER